MSEALDLRFGLLGLLYIAVVVFSWRFIVRGRQRFKTSKVRAFTWWWGVVMSVACAVLATVSMNLPKLDRFVYRLSHEIVRITALFTGVVFLVYAVVALLPVWFDRLENRGFASFVSARLMRANKSGFLTVISVLSILGVAVSSCALCSVTSIMGGFGYDLKSKILGNTAHIVIDVTKPGGFDGYQEVLEAVRAELKAKGGAATPVAGGDAMASSSTNTAGTLMRGIEPDSIGTVIKLRDNIEVGKFDYLLKPERLLKLGAEEVIGRGPGGEPYLKGPGFALPNDLSGLGPTKKVFPGIILGRELAKSLHVMVGDELTMLSPMGELGPSGIMPRSRKFRVAAIFYSGMYEYDASHAYVLLGEAQKFFSLDNRISNIDIRIPKPEIVAQVTPSIRSVVAKSQTLRPSSTSGTSLRVRDWKTMNKNLFSALKLEKIATFIILSIAIAIASFCIICTLLLMVTEKSKEIAVLKALGAADRAVMKVFMIEGVLIGAVGTVLGVSVALAQCLGLSWTGVRLDPDVYYIDRLPVNVDLVDYGLVTLATLAICTIATIYPAYTASRVRPVDGLRYE